MFTSLAVGATAISAIFLTVLIGASIAIVQDARNGKDEELANKFWASIVLILLTSPMVGATVLLWHKALT